MCTLEHIEKQTRMMADFPVRLKCLVEVREADTVAAKEARAELINNKLRDNY